MCLLSFGVGFFALWQHVSMRKLLAVPFPSQLPVPGWTPNKAHLSVPKEVFSTLPESWSNVQKP